MQEIYRRTPMPKRDFNKAAFQFIEIARRHGCFPANLLHIFRTPLPKKTFGWLLLLCFQAVEKRCIGNKWVNMILSKYFIRGQGGQGGHFPHFPIP